MDAYPRIIDSESACEHCPFVTWVNKTARCVGDYAALERMHTVISAAFIKAHLMTSH